MKMIQITFLIVVSMATHSMLLPREAVFTSAASIQEYLNKAFLDKSLQKHISLRVKQATITDVLEMISVSAGINMTIDSDVQGTVGKFVVEDQAAGNILSVVCNQHQPRLGMIKQLGAWRVMPYQAAVDLLKSSYAEPLVEQVFLVKYVSCDDTFKAKITEVWRRIIGQSVIGHCTLDSESRKIFVRALRAHVKELEKFLKEIDCPTPRVRIDAVVAEVDRRYEQQLGFNWSGIYNRNPSSHFHLVGIGSSGDGAQSVQGSIHLATNAASTSIPFVFAGPNLNLQRILLELRAAEAASRAKILLNPSVLTNHGETAEIVIGNSVPIKTFIEDVVQGKVRNVQSVQYKDVGTILNVKPHVSTDLEEVSLEIWVENSSIPSTDTHDQAPVIKTIRTKNKVTLHSGQTTAIGGLMLNSDEASRGEFPVLARIPLLGILFRGKQQLQHDSQLLIFITPTVVK